MPCSRRVVAIECLNVWGNADNGIQAIINTSVLITGGTLTSSSNGDDGIVIGTSSAMQIISGTIVTLENNMDNGLSVVQASATVFSSNLEVTSRNNTGAGILIGLGAFASLDGTLTVEGNGAGDIVDQNQTP